MILLGRLTESIDIGTKDNFLMEKDRVKLPRDLIARYVSVDHRQYVMTYQLYARAARNGKIAHYDKPD